MREPLVDLGLFRHRTYSAVNAATLSFGIAFAMMFFAFFFYMGNVWHYSQALAGLAIAPGPLMVIPVAIVTGRLAGRFGHRPFLVGGALLYAAAGLWFLLVPGTEPAYLTHWLPGLLLSGASVGLVLPSLSGAAVSQLPAQHYAVGSAVNQATRQIGAVIGVAITVLLLGHGACSARLRCGVCACTSRWRCSPRCCAPSCRRSRPPSRRELARRSSAPCAACAPRRPVRSATPSTCPSRCRRR